MDFSTMNGYEFERFITNLLSKLGFKAQQTSLSGDGGIDIEAINDKPLLKGLYLIQCKNWANPVGQPQVRDLYGVVMSRRANKGVLITTSSFTDQAKQFAEGLNIELIDGRLLNEIVASVESPESVAIAPHDLSFLDDASFEKDRYTYLRKKLENNRDYNSYEEFLAFLLSYVQPCSFPLLRQGLDKEIISICDDMLSRFCKSNKRDAEKRSEHIFIKAYLYFVTGQIASCIECLNEIGLFQFNMRADNYVPCTLSFPMHTDRDRSHCRTIDNRVLYDYCNHRYIMVTNLFILANTIDDNDLDAFETFINKGITAQTFSDNSHESAKFILYLADYTLDAINQTKHKNNGYKWYPYFFNLQKGTEYSISNTCFKSRAVDVKESLVDNWDNLPQIRNDMNKMARTLGFIGATTESSSESKETDHSTVDPQTLHGSNLLLLKRAYQLLENGEWYDAKEYCELALDFDSENAEVYLVMLMAELHVKKRDDLKNQSQPFDTLMNYQQAMHFGDESLKKELTEMVAFIKERNETAQRESVYKNALLEMDKKTEQSYRYAAIKFSRISGYKDADAFAKKCLEKAEEIKKEAAEREKAAAQLINRAKSIAATIKSYIEEKNGLSLREKLLSTRAMDADEAIKDYLSDSEITCIVNSIYPLASLISFMQEKTDSFLYGKYLQKKDGISEPIEWQMLTTENDRVLVISKYALECKQYNTYSVNTSWETCTLRKWLKEEFMNAAFSADEKNAISDILLLSVDEVNKFFRAKTCIPTDYAMIRDDKFNKRIRSFGNAPIGWWLRSRGQQEDMAAYVAASGILIGRGIVVSNFLYVRPAMWIDLSRV